MSKLLTKIFATILRRKLIQQPDGTNQIKWYHSETIIAGLVVGLEGVYHIARMVAEQHFQTQLPEIPEAVLNTINMMLGGTVVWGRYTASSKIEPLKIPEK